MIPCRHQESHSWCFALRAHPPNMDCHHVRLRGSDSTERSRSHDSKFFHVSFMFSNVIQRRILGFVEDFLLFERLRAHTGPRMELYRTSARLLSRKVHRDACIKMYSDAQCVPTSGLEVTFVFLSCRKVKRLRDVSREGRVSLAVSSATFAQVLRPVRLSARIFLESSSTEPLLAKLPRTTPLLSISRTSCAILEMSANPVIALTLESTIGQDNDWQCS